MTVHIIYLMTALKEKGRVIRMVMNTPAYFLGQKKIIEGIVVVINYFIAIITPTNQLLKLVSLHLS